MPELPEVETVRRGLDPLLTGRTVTGVVIRSSQLRWPIDPGLDICLSGQRIESLSRRAKYLLLNFTHGTLLLHLGMSGVVRVVEPAQPASRHDHVDILLDDGRCLRLNDPRRFGALLWAGAEPLTHPLLRLLGPEPLSSELSGDYLFARSRGRRSAVKTFIMDQKVVVGVGNIYASEALFRAGIDPSRPAGEIGSRLYVRLVDAIKAVLAEAIDQGGTTLRDFSDAHGRPGYFAQSLRVYGRVDQPCLNCGEPIRSTRIGGRASCHCPHCQK